MLRRPRRNRKSSVIREMVKETQVRSENLVYPLFITDGKKIKSEVPSLPGNFRWSGDLVLGEIESCMKMGLNSFILFPKVNESLKDPYGSYAISPENFYNHIAKKIKNTFPECCLISDVALDPYNSDGHDGLVKDGEILNDETIEILAKMAVMQAEAGFDIIGPSDMMDGRVRAIRMSLDHAGFKNTSIMSYTAKYASAFYGPFRDALDSQPLSSENVPSDKKSYQMDPANRREAALEARLDIEEGSDYLMVKPALHYLDVIHLLKSTYELPIAAYHVSGECALLIAADRMGWLDFQKALPETLLSIRRAGADIIITYFAKQFIEDHL